MRNGLEMLVVLMQRVLELILLPIDRLGPLPRSRISKDPARQVLCFDHKDAEHGNDDMIYLCSAVFRWQYQVVKGTVHLFIQAKTRNSSNLQLADKAPESGRPKYEYDD